MTILYLSSNLSTLKSKISEGQDWVALIDDIDEEFAPSWKNNLVLVSDLEREMYNKSEKVKRLEKDILEWIKKWANIPVLDDKSIKQLLEYEDTSLWWLAETMLYKDSFGRYSSLTEIVKRCETMKYALNKYKPERLIVESLDGLTARCAFQVAEHLGIHMEILKGRRHLGDSEFDEFYPRMVALVKGTRTSMRAMIANINKGSFSQDPKKKHTVLFLSNYLSLRRGKEPDEDQMSDIVFEPISQVLQEKHSISPRTMYIDRRYPLGLSSVKELASPNFPADLYEKVFSVRQAGENRRLRNVWNELKRSKTFHGSLVFNGINLWPLLKDYFAFLFIKQFPKAVRCIHLMENALIKEGIRIVVIHNETSLYGRALIIASKKSDIKTIGIQHGNIGENHIDYFHTGEELPCPIPDITAVWGSCDHRALLESPLYNEENIVITGTPRYDVLSKANEKYSKEDLFERFKIDKDKIVAITTQPFPIVSEREYWLKAVISTSKNIDDALFIVKPHPAEKVNMHETICKDYGGDNVIVTKNIDTNELMYVADITITAWSTTGLESIILGTPLMTVNLTGQEDKMPYVKYGAAIGVNKEEDITIGIRNVLDGDLPPKLRENMDRFVHDYAYKIDGKASERVVDIIQKCIEEYGS